MSIPMKPSDPAYWMLSRKTPDITEQPDFILGGVEKTPVYSSTCYICRDPEFAQMGLPLCYPCKKCKGHVPADAVTCDDCGYDDNNFGYDYPPDCNEEIDSKVTL